MFLLSNKSLLFLLATISILGGSLFYLQEESSFFEFFFNDFFEDPLSSIFWGLVCLFLVCLFSAYILADFKKIFYESLGGHKKSPYLILSSSGRVVFHNSDFIKTFGPLKKKKPFENIFKKFNNPQLETFCRDSFNYKYKPGEYREFCFEDSLSRECFHISVKNLQNLSGATAWHFENITESKRLYDHAAKSLLKFKHFFNKTQLGVYILNDEGIITYINNSFAGWLGADAESLLGKPIFSYIEHSNIPQEDFLKEAENTSFSFLNHQGENIGISLYQHVLNFKNTRQYIAIGRNISHEVEDQTSPYLGHFKNLFEEAPVGVVLLDLHGVIQDCNQTFHRMLGDNDILEGKNFGDFIVPDQRAEVFSKLSQMTNTSDQIHPIEVKLHDKGKNIVASLYVKKFQDPSNKDLLLLHFIDITEQKQLQVQVLQSQKMQAVGQLAGGIAHDFNNLLTAMIGFCDLLLMRHTPGDHSFTDIMQIKQNANRAANLVRQLLAFSRQQSLQPRLTNITDSLAELMNLLNRLMGADVSIKMIHGRDLWNVKVDQGQLEQVIINLAVNARDAMASGGELVIRTQNVSHEETEIEGQEVVPSGDYVSIEVVDTGTGIKSEHIERIFEPFFSTKEIGAGTGLGLSMVYGIIKQMQGYILVDTKEGEGTTFKILLPKYTATATASVQAQKEKSLEGDLTGSATILLVEDEDAVRMFCARALKDKGYKVFEAENGEAALTFLRKNQEIIDLLISDVVMPGMNGPTLIKEAMEIQKNMRVIFISGYTEDTFRKDLDQNVNLHFLPKPFNFKQLAVKVREVLKDESLPAKESA